MLKPTVQLKADSKEELLKLTEEELKKATLLSEKIHSTILYNRMNMLLKEKTLNWEDDIRKLLKDKSYFVEKNTNNVIKVIDAFLQLENDSVLDLISDMDEFKTLYFKIFFYLRRMELNFDVQYYLDILELIKKWNLTIDHILIILRESSIVDKQNVCMKLIEIM